MNASQHQTARTGTKTDLSEARCECGQLVAKLGAGSLELKCKRCKRLVSIPFSALSHSEVTVSLCAATPSSGITS